MHTRISPPTDSEIRRAANLIRDGETVAFPTETVYGLGANALNADAVLKIFAAKNRPADNPLIVHVHSAEAAEPLCEVSDDARKLMAAFWPGPLTLLLPKKPVIPAVTNAGLNSVAVRMPDHPVALKLLTQSGLPIAAPSANRSGRPSPTTAMHVWDDMQGRIPMILDGGPCRVGLESTVLDMTGETPAIVRPGGVTLEMLKAILPGVHVAETAMRPLQAGETAISPGMRHTHYAPKGELTLVEGEPGKVEAACKRLYRQAKADGKAVCLLVSKERLPVYEGFATYALGSLQAPETIAHTLFAALRQMDDDGMQVIICEAVEASGIGLAVMNRLRRAADFRVVRA
ncbi:MAG TPA: L-threonylcarbamoyladenylate synthase [Candidatus Limiplasma sp.]|nr:L-threonylcarbamoyladenylate synthase [Candidatus Limiplasma sp.]